MPLDARSDAWAALALKGLPQRDLVTLLRALGDPDSVMRASRSTLKALLPAAAVDRTLAAPRDGRLAATRAWLDAPDHELIAWDDPDYPRALLDVGDAPPILFHVGRRDLLNRTSVAVVGTGLDRVYPARNRELAHVIALRGALVSEYPPGTPPLKENFPRRNRLLSGLARGVLVVEATLSSGSLITARLAGEQGREVFAIPGSIHSPFSKGPHKLIREGAKLVETAQDILEELGASSPAPQALQAQAAPAPAGDAAQVPAALGHDPASIDTIAARSGLPAHIVSASLIELELAGAVASLPGGTFQRLG